MRFSRGFCEVAGWLFICNILDMVLYRGTEEICLNISYMSGWSGGWMHVYMKKYQRNQ